MIRLHSLTRHGRFLSIPSPLKDSGGTVQAISQLHFTLLNRTSINHIVEELSPWTLSLYVPGRLWPKRSISSSDQLMGDSSSPWQTNGLLHKARLAVDSGGKDINNLTDSCNKHEKGSLGGFIACSLPLIKEKLLRLFLSSYCVLAVVTDHNSSYNLTLSVLQVRSHRCGGHQGDTMSDGRLSLWSSAIYQVQPWLLIQLSSEALWLLSVSTPLILSAGNSQRHCCDGP